MPEKEDKPKIKAVLDTNVLIAAFLRRGGVNAKVLKRAGRDFRLYLGEPTLVEFHRVLLIYQRIRRRYHYSDAEAEEFIERLRTVSEEVFSNLPEVSVIQEDPKDDFILSCAICTEQTGSSLKTIILPLF